MEIPDLCEIKTTPRNPDEGFYYNGNPLGFKLLDFWAWNQSDLIENRNRGVLAEFIVRQALDVKYPTRLEWDTFDLVTDDNLKLEVKSAAYVQAWKQKTYSSISFDIRPTKNLLDNNNYSLEPSRQADIYIFCLLHHKDQKTIDPLDLNQWTFYLITTDTLNRKFPLQKSIRISTIEAIPHEKCGYGEIRECFEKTKVMIPILTKMTSEKVTK